jgi:hypothetical protein|tara:strand:- start:249 stop:428 length:180 start_codon:yes stop_codon:yes gene_type:complete
MARGLHVQPNVIYRKMPYLKLLAWLRILEYEDQDRQRVDREQRIDSQMRSFPEQFRRTN